MNKKVIKYVVILVTIGLVFFAKNKIDTRNSKQQAALDSIDDNFEE